MSTWASEFFTGKTVVITGGTSGIGQGIGQAFADAGAIVHVTGATQVEVEAGAQAEPRFRYTQLDVRNSEQVAEYAADFVKVDVLINCAGVNLRAAEHTVEGFETVIDINLNGSMRTAYAFRGKLFGGAVLNIGSMFSFFGAPHAPAYSASKHAVAGLTKSLAAALAKENIRVNALAPGWIETAMTAVPRANETRNAELMARTPMGRWGTPADLAPAALFLCSPLAGFITGAVLPIDGGYLVN
ncbi:SDR family oxidoreductase [Devosia sp. ZB163]|uniref:SDR family NAD(P)-dependent oxidoreductase n=1 Tax=Devosia sp. ZB163 TaxID=3025938 RepID=UPI00235E95C8|nr:SDR family oxidoreductase [Devosia sp. ZB163]MDC9823152.1 SDR family oxidoreductase [Devosia sp. ZB163]